MAILTGKETINMAFKLKENQPDIEVVDGAYAHRKYKAGVLYHDIPPEEAHKFDVVGDAQPTDPMTEPKPEDKED